METSLPDEKSAEEDTDPDQVVLRSHVEVDLIGESGASEHLTFAIVPDREANFSAGLLARSTPLAQAVLGQPAASVVPYRAGDIVEVRIVKVTPSTRLPGTDAAADRQATIQKAISKSEMADAVRFALTVDQKWGDTDPEAMESNWE
jgi:hypothetical protein